MPSQDDKTPNAPDSAASSPLRLAMPIEKAYCISLPEHLAICAVCPRCGRVIPRDYAKTCQSCGQVLSWERFSPENLDRLELL